MAEEFQGELKLGQVVKIVSQDCVDVTGFPVGTLGVITSVEPDVYGGDRCACTWFRAPEVPQTLFTDGNKWVEIVEDQSDTREPLNAIQGAD